MKDSFVSFVVVRLDANLDRVKWPLLAGLIFVALVFAALAAEEPPGQRLKLTHGSWFIPAAFKGKTNGAFDLILHLHGAPDVVEANFTEAKWHGGLKLLSRFRKGQCEILGFEGDTGTHHQQNRNLLVHKP